MGDDLGSVGGLARWSWELGGSIDILPICRDGARTGSSSVGRYPSDQHIGFIDIASVADLGNVKL